MKKRYIFFAIITILSLPGLLVDISAGNFFSLDLIAFLSLIYVLYLLNKIEKQASTESGLNRNETIQVVITEVLTPLLAGAFYYYTWRNKFPKKANRANLYSWIIAAIEGMMVIILRGLIKL